MAQPPPPRRRRPSADSSDSDSDAASPGPLPASVALSAQLFPGQARSLSGVALRAYCLGLVSSTSLLLLILLSPSSPLWRAPFFALALSAFHFLEFWATARRNTLAATTDSFLLTANWPAYAVAHAAAFLECVLVNAFRPDRRWAGSTVVVVVGLVLVLVGQAVRSAAMLRAGASFNHQVQLARAESHVLVTGGVYAWLRHPSYFGFFYWGLGTQLVCGNVVCFFVYAVVLWTFFSRRVRVEEAKLVEFFGDDYVQYRKRVGTGMPFI
ncbi:protein-S-isoprenylcysteine O-methyltransferase [Cordyceps fumosorosea ARSEF 2679]|uniref:Protein-S-isoprenylcysteine O-methyltransferase n=1 Tax=Cordyceps fumosorosea (strain ARSEF 2679) TaxID=1081104 RepID=A0A167YGX9_CORFA|nr:protein-S-isoprenylcysteine O-methyltransferase [Cordyceps fumosorosea ARSEF 2679]OAA66313.1 protein-S-isoprenylcysteine O-methyltransferase [Cordyceps fumosorosea ARSEF 2679]